MPKTGLGTALARGNAGRSVLDVAREMIAISRAGLDARTRLDATGSTEAHFLDALDAILACGQSPAAVQLRLYESEWNRDITRIYDAFAY